MPAPRSSSTTNSARRSPGKCVRLPRTSSTPDACQSVWGASFAVLPKSINTIDRPIRRAMILTSIRVTSVRTFTAAAFLTCAHGAFAQRSGAASQAQYDLVIANGTIIDGTGAPRYRGDVAIVGDRVVRVERGSLPTNSA